MTREEAFKLRELLKKAAESLEDEDAMDAVQFFPKYEVGKAYKGPNKDRFQYNGILYKVNQNHTSQADWEPDKTPALYTVLAREDQGDSATNPIPYNGNMELVEGKYYSQNGVVYFCFRSTGIAVYHNLADLVNLFVRVYEG